MADEEADRVKGTGIMASQAEAGLKLFKQDADAKTDLQGATKYKEEFDAKINALEDKAKTLTGKDNKTERSQIGKDVAAMKIEKKYIDACKVVKGLEPKNGFFIANEAEIAATAAANKAAIEAAAAESAAAEQAEKDKKDKSKDKPKKEAESTGISKEERDELEKLKDQIVGRKMQLKEEGMSGGQQNKDPEISGWVKRMNELKEKQDPGSTQVKKKDPKKSKQPLSAEEEKELDSLRGEVEAYTHRLKTEFGYTNKDIKADQDLKDMQEKLKAFEKRAG